MGAEEESAVVADEEAALPWLLESARLSSCWRCRQLSPAPVVTASAAGASLLLGWVSGWWVGGGLSACLCLPL